MLNNLINRLESEGIPLQHGASATGLTQISGEYLKAVAGGITVADDASCYSQYAQNYGDSGPHPQPFWQNVTC